MKELEKIEAETIEANFKTKEKERETEIREHLETKFFEEKKTVKEQEQKNREELLRELTMKTKDENAKSLAERLLEGTKK